MSSFGQDPTIFSWSSPTELSFIWEETKAPVNGTVLDVNVAAMTDARRLKQRQLSQQTTTTTSVDRLRNDAPKSSFDVAASLQLDFGKSRFLEPQQGLLWESGARGSDAPIFEEASETYYQQQRQLLRQLEPLEPPMLPRARLQLPSEDEFDHVTSTSSLEDAVADSFDPATEDEDSREIDTDGTSSVMDLSVDSLDAESVDDTLGLEEDAFDGTGVPEGIRLDAIKLKASKSPIMDALVYCALNGWGIKLIQEDGDHIQFQVEDFRKYYKYSARICAKQNPTEDQASRIKALKRWFPDFPTKRERGKIESPFLITVAKGNKKDNKPKKMREIIDRNRRLLGIQKTRRAKY